MRNITQVTNISAANGGGGGGFGTGGLTNWIQENVVTLVILVLAVCVLWAAKGGQISKGITIVAGLLLGIVVLGLASGNNAQDIGNWAIGLFRG